MAVGRSWPPQWEQARPSGVPHSSQNSSCGEFSCWHRGHCIRPPSRSRQTGCAELSVATRSDQARRPWLVSPWRLITFGPESRALGCQVHARCFELEGRGSLWTREEHFIIPLDDCFARPSAGRWWTVRSRGLPPRGRERPRLYLDQLVLVYVKRRIDFSLLALYRSASGAPTDLVGIPKANLAFARSGRVPIGPVLSNALPAMSSIARLDPTRRGDSSWPSSMP